MPCKESVVCVPQRKVFLTLWTCVLMFNVLLTEASYDFTVRFYEFRNHLGLQCGECGTSGGLPACCDDVQRRENCNMTRPFTCDTRFRFLLRPFGASVETVRNSGFPNYTPGEGRNSHTFSESPNGLLGLSNPFTISSTTEWPGRIQFYIDAIDRPIDMSTSGLSETLAIINRFPIDLELDPGTNFTERTTYTGIYNISGLGFDMSFRVQCADNFFGPNCCPEENYFGPNCATFCKPVEGVYTCDREGRVVCLHDNQDPSTSCSTCLQGWDLTTSCTTCSLYYDDQSQCTQCVTGRDTTTNCTTCLPGYDTSLNCTQCLSGYDPSTNCEQCIPGFDPLTNCRECLSGYDISENCTQCVSGVQCTTAPETTPTEQSTSSSFASDASLNLAVVGGAVGGAAGVLIILLLILFVVIVAMAMQLKRHRKSVTFSATGAVNGAGIPAFSRDLSVKDRTETVRFGEHDFENPLYDEAKQEEQCQGDSSDYSKLQRPPMQKSFSPPKFPYTIDRSEETTYQLDVAGKSGTMEGHPGYDIAYPPSYNENGGVYNVTHHVNNSPYDVTHHPSLNPQPSPSALAGGIYNLANYTEEQIVYDVANHPPPSAASGLVELPHNDYADIPDLPETTAVDPDQQHDYADIPEAHTSAPHYDYADAAPPPPHHMDDPSTHVYAETEQVMTPHPSESSRPSMSPVAYTNTTPGQVTPEALNHYDFGQ